MYMDLSRNQKRVLRSIFYLKTATRNTIVKYTNFSLVLVSSILNSLEERGIITKTGKTKTRGGRPSYIFQLQPGFGYSIGISMGIDSLRIAITDSTRELILDELHPLILSSKPENHQKEILDQISKVFNKTLNNNSINRNSIFSIGLALPGIVDSDRGVWLQGFQLSGIINIAIRRVFEEKFKLPVIVEDQARTVTFFEKTKGLGRDIDNFVLLYLGVGIGSGVIINGSLYRGYHGLAGEIGHLIVDKNGYRCSCGNIGCLETIASTPGILRAIRDRLEEGVISSLQDYSRADWQELNLENIFKAANHEDRLAESTLFNIGLFLGDGCSKLIKLFNPEKLIISGPGSIFKDYFKEAINRVIKKQVIPVMLSGISLDFADYSPNQEAFGASLLAMEYFWEKETNMAK